MQNFRLPINKVVSRLKLATTIDILRIEIQHRLLLLAATLQWSMVQLFLNLSQRGKFTHLRHVDNVSAQEHKVSDCEGC